MQYDQLGFPIPAEFDPLVDQDERDGFSRPPRSRAASAGSPQRGKRRFLGLLAGLVIVPLVVGPSLLPVVREGVIEWSLKRAIAH